MGQVSGCMNVSRSGSRTLIWEPERSTSETAKGARIGLASCQRSYAPLWKSICSGWQFCTRKTWPKAQVWRRCRMRWPRSTRRPHPLLLGSSSFHPPYCGPGVTPAGWCAGIRQTQQSSGHLNKLYTEQGFISMRASIRCVTALPHICWLLARTSEQSSYSWVIVAFKRR